MTSLLPPNATKFERDLEAVGVSAFAELGVDIATLWDPATCPPALLGWLAWALSVDTWDNAWPDAIKRRVIANAPAVHRAKGTRAAVAAALDGLMVKAGITEWWQPGGSNVAGTFVIRAYANARWSEGAPLVTPELIASIRALVTASAPASRSWTLQVGVAASAGLGVGVAVAKPLRLINQAATASICQTIGARAGVAMAGQAARLVDMNWRLVA